MFKRSIIVGLIVGFLAFPAAAPAAAPGAPAAFGSLAALSQLIDRLETVLPLSAQTKALAHLRLAESKIEGLKQAKKKDAKELLREYRREMKEARKLAKKARGDAAAQVDEATAKHIEVLEGVLAKVPVQAQDAIRHAIEASGHGIENSAAAREKERGPGAKGQGNAAKKDKPHWPKGDAGKIRRHKPPRK